jgi:hypothetical protein
MIPCPDQLCSDDKTSCCETDVLKSLLSDDWSPNDLENWGPKFFGACKLVIPEIV